MEAGQVWIKSESSLDQVWIKFRPSMDKLCVRSYQQIRLKPLHHYTPLRYTTSNTTPSTNPSTTPNTTPSTTPNSRHHPIAVAIATHSPLALSA